MMPEDTHKSLVVHLDPAYNPYSDTTLHETQPDPPTLNDREPFNDVVKQGDIVVGYRRNRTLDQYPTRVRPFMKFYVIAGFVLFVGTMLWNFWNAIR